MENISTRDAFRNVCLASSLFVQDKLVAIGKVDDSEDDEYNGLGDDGADGDHEDHDDGDDASGQVVVPGALVVVGSRALGAGRQLNLLLAAC